MKLNHILLFLIVSSLLTLPVSATDVSACGTYNTAGEVLSLTQSISINNGRCIIIAADNVVFNGNDYWINSTGASSSYASVYAEGISNLTINHTKISSNNTGIDFRGSGNASFKDITITGGGDGMYSQDSDGTQQIIVSNLTMYDIYYAYVGFTNISISDSTVNDTFLSWGVFGDNSYAINSTFNYSSGAGLTIGVGNVDSNVTLRNITVAHNEEGGIEIGNNVQANIYNSTIKDNSYKNDYGDYSLRSDDFISTIVYDCDFIDYRRIYYSLSSLIFRQNNNGLQINTSMSSNATYLERKVTAWVTSNMNFSDRVNSIVVQSNTSNMAASSMTRIIASWSVTNTTWTDNVSTSTVMNYTVSGLSASTWYIVYNNNVKTYTLKTNAAGALPIFKITLSSPHTIKILSSACSTVSTCNLPTYNNNGFNVVNYDFQGNGFNLLNFSWINLTGGIIATDNRAPTTRVSSPVNGSLNLNLTDNILEVYSNGAWRYSGNGTIK